MEFMTQYLVTVDDGLSKHCPTCNRETPVYVVIERVDKFPTYVGTIAQLCCCICQKIHKEVKL